MPIQASQLALAALVGWSAIGLVGVRLSWMHHERRKARRGLAWIAAVVVTYTLTLLLVSRFQPQRRVPFGQQACFGDLCLAIAGAEELRAFTPNLPAQTPKAERLLRVSIRIISRRKAGLAADSALRVVLHDAQGRIWYPVPGLSGVPLSTSLAPGASILSEPVFRIPEDAQGLTLNPTRGRWQPGFFEIGNSDSWLHRPTQLLLSR